MMIQLFAHAVCWNKSAYRNNLWMAEVKQGNTIIGIDAINAYRALSYIYKVI